MGNEEAPSITSFRKFYMDVANGMRNVKHTVVVSSDREVLDLLDKATLLPKWFKEVHGITASFGASKDVCRTGFTFRAANCQFIVTRQIGRPAKKAPAKKGVAITSIDAYHAIDTRKQAGVVAKAAIELTKERGKITDRMVSAYTGLECARVSARRIDSLEPVQGYILDGKAYYFKHMGEDQCPTTGKRVQWWAMLPAEPEQLQIFGG